MSGEGDRPAPLQALLTALKGFCMGAADVVPGISGGTMAFVLGIYPQLLAAIRSFDLAWLGALLRLDLATALRRPHLPFLLPLLTGIGTALWFFTHVIPLPRLLRVHPEPVYGLFFGLIGGSVLVLWRELRIRGLVDIGHLLLGAGLAALVLNLVPVATPETWWFVMFSGSLAICAMILPGISGSYILLLLNKYAYVLEAVGSFDLRVLLPFAVGAAAGLALFSRLLSWLLVRFYHPVMAVITGFLIASLWRIWPWQERIYASVAGRQVPLQSHPRWPDPAAGGDFVLVVALAAGGLLLVLAVDAIARRLRASGG
ncbi:MAG: DUF368 domain-containing protein [Gammaproteobacteria bacterium]|nr:MAG: DUF368 domain-containing protein [Gammaproteobacteria bacterium]